MRTVTPVSWMALWTNTAGRKTALSMFIPARPGRRASRASSMPLVTSRVWAVGSFSTMSMRPGLPLTMASPMSGWWSSTTLVTSPRRRGAPSAPLAGPLSSDGSMGTPARSVGVMSGETWRTASRWLGASKNPPVPGDEASRKLSDETHSEFPAVLTIWDRETPLSSRRFGSTWTWSWRSR